MPTIRVGPTVLREIRLRSWGELIQALRTMDLDEGIRVEGRIPGLKGGGFLFVGRLDKGFTVNITARVYYSKLGRYIAVGRGEWATFKTVEEVVAYLKERAKQPLRAWLY